MSFALGMSLPQWGAALRFFSLPFLLSTPLASWCQDIASCAARAYTPTNCFLGSSNASCFNADNERCANKSAAMAFSCLPACNGAWF